MDKENKLEWEDGMPAGPEPNCQSCSHEGRDQSLVQVHGWSTSAKMSDAVPSKSQFQLSTYFNEITYMALEGVISLHTMQPKDMHNSLHVVWLAHYQKWWLLFTEAWLSALQLRESLIGLLVLVLVPHTVCLPSLRASEVPQATTSLEVAVTSSRTDIVIFHSKELHLLLLWQHLRGPSCCTGIGSGVLRVPANTS